MNPEEYPRMYELEGSYWYFQGRRSIIRGLLRKNGALDNPEARILDVGCGTGLMLETLRNLGHAPVGLDLNPLSMSYCRQRRADRLVRADVTELPFEDNSFDLILALDLAEHVEDDRKLLSEFHRVAAPGAKILITVPAHPFLWSEHDEALHHFRRYTYKNFLEKLGQAKLKPLRYTYAIALLYAPIIVFRALRRRLRGEQAPKTHLIELPAPINWFLIQLLRLEGLALRRVNLPFGVTLLALLEPEKP